MVSLRYKEGVVHRMCCENEEDVFCSSFPQIYTRRMHTYKKRRHRLSSPLSFFPLRWSLRDAITSSSQIRRPETKKRKRGKRKKCEHGMETMSNDTTYSARKIGGIRNGLRRKRKRKYTFSIPLLLFTTKKKSLFSRGHRIYVRVTWSWKKEKVVALLFCIGKNFFHFSNRNKKYSIFLERWYIVNDSRILEKASFEFNQRMSDVHNSS